MMMTTNFGVLANKKKVITISGGTNLNISNAWLTANGWNGISSVILVNTGQIISSATTTAALIISAAMPSNKTLSFINSVGAGVYGKGGAATHHSYQAQSPSGGAALSVTAPVSIYNNGIIAGGGGSGGTSSITGGLYSGKGADESPATAGGNGYNTLTYYSSGSNGSAGNNSYGATGVGAAGAGGIGSTAGGTSYSMCGFGGGGAWGSSGGSSGSSGAPQYSAGAGGAAVTGNANIVWTVAGNRYGAIG